MTIGSVAKYDRAEQAQNKKGVNKLKIILGILVLLAVLCIPVVAQPAFASHPCPVCGNSVGYGGQITWQTWEVQGHPCSGWILCCEKCGYTTCRDANGNIPDPYLANKAWQGKMFPWIYNGWTHQQYVDWFYK